MNQGTQRSRGRRWGLQALCAVVAALFPVVGLGAHVAAADTPDQHDPLSWPTAAGTNPDTDANASGIRYFGADRYQTNFATELAMRSGSGDSSDFQFDSSDRTNGNDPVLADDNNWYGSDGSPQAIIIAAGDKFPDSLAASSLSTPGDNHNFPNPGMNVVDETVETDVDTEDAPIVITHSTREGATGLSATAFNAATDLGPNGYQDIDTAIIVGGPAAVPTGVEHDLEAIGYTHIFRLGGFDRFETARLVGLANVPSTGTTADCSDSDATDGTQDDYQATAGIDLHTSDTECTFLNQTVFLADGLTGADALSVGWESSFFGVPILLTSANGSIPSPTATALQTMNIQNIVVLGGTARIPDSTKAAAASLAGIPATSTYRVAGADRYDTSVQMAKQFGGWYPQGDTTFADDYFCLAASSGEGDNAAGWPDDLGAGPLCADFGGDADNTGSPQRDLPPAAGSDQPANTGDPTPSHYAVPILLTPTGSGSLAGSVSSFLADAFPATPNNGDVWCSGNNWNSCDENPGYFMAFGGTAVIPEAAFQAASKLASAGTYTTFGDTDPTLANGFWTMLDETANGNSSSNDAFLNGSNGVQGCYGADALKDVRWLSTYDDIAKTYFEHQYDVIANGDYVKGHSRAVCAKLDAANHAGVATEAIFGDSISNHWTPGQLFTYTDAHKITMSGPVGPATAASASAAPSTNDPGSGSGATSTYGTSNTETFAQTGLSAPQITVKGTSYVVTGYSISVTITRAASATAGGADKVGSFTATFTITTSGGTLTGTASGFAVPNSNTSTTTWQLRGSSTFTGGTLGVTTGGGGFHGDLGTGNDTDNTNDTLTWQVDGLA